MTRQQLLARQREAARAASHVDVPGFLFLFGGLVAFVPIVRHLCTCYPHYRVYPAACFGLVLFLVVNYALASWCLHRRLRRYGLRCPACGASMFGGAGRFAVHTSRCRKCGELIVSQAQPAWA